MCGFAAPSNQSDSTDRNAIMRAECEKFLPKEKCEEIEKNLPSEKEIKDIICDKLERQTGKDLCNGSSSSNSKDNSNSSSSNGSGSSSNSGFGSSYGSSSNSGNKSNSGSGNKSGSGPAPADKSEKCQSTSCGQDEFLNSLTPNR